MPNNNNMPTIRFNGFDGEWKEYPIKNICSVNPQSYLPDVFEYVDLESVEGTEMVTHRTEVKGHAPSRAQRVARKGDIFFQTVRPYQKNNYYFDQDDDNYVFSTGYAQLRTTSINGGFLFALMQTQSFVNKVMLKCTGSSYPAINSTDLSNICVSVAVNSNEQTAIAKYFTALDGLIQATAKELEKLRTVKAASLQSLFPQEGQTSPKLRFKGFTGEWKRVKLEEYLEVSKDINAQGLYTKENVLSVSDEVGVVNQIEFLGRSYAGKSVANYHILRTDEIVYTKSPLKSKPFGIIKCNKGENGIVSTLYAIYRAKDNCNPLFVDVYFSQSARMNKYIHPLVNKGAKNDMKVANDAVLKGYVTFPSFPEQTAIVNYFTSLDNQIDLQAKRLEKLRNIKAACLDNMFV